MLILVEGCDKTGKSTLINGLKDKLPGAVVIKNPFKPERGPLFVNGVYAGMYNSLRSHLDKHSVPIFIDRSHITELVYAKVLRGYDAREYFEWDEYETSLLEYSIVLYTYANVRTIKARFVTDKETYVEPSFISLLLDEYDEYFKHSNLRRLRLDSGVLKPDKMIEKSLSFIGSQRSMLKL